MKRRFLGVAILIAIVTGSVFAQSIPGGIDTSLVTDILDAANTDVTIKDFYDVINSGFESPQSQSTQGLFASDADDFINPTAYTGLELQKWFGMASFAATEKATLGYAAKLGGLYLGVFYSGDFWTHVKAVDSSENFANNNWLGTTAKKLNYVAPAFRNEDDFPYNQFAILIGVADMGFRLSFITTHQIFQAEEAIITGTGVPAAGLGSTVGNSFKSYLEEYGLISPQLAWGFAKDLTKVGIRPWFTFDLHFYRDYVKYQGYQLVGGNYSTRKEYIGRSNNYVAPEFNLGLGGLTLGEKDGWSTSLDLTLGLLIAGFENEYNYNDSNGDNAIKTIKGISYGTNLAELSASLFTLTPSLGTEWKGEKLSLKANLDLNFGFLGFEMTSMAVYNTSGDLRNNGPTAKIAGFAFTPDIQLAAQWQLASKLSVNVGGRININAVTVLTADGKNYDGVGNEIANSEYQNIAATFGETENHLTLGVTINPIDNLSIQINAFDTIDFYPLDAGVFKSASILISVKF